MGVRRMGGNWHNRCPYGVRSRHLRSMTVVRHGEGSIGGTSCGACTRNLWVPRVWLALRLATAMLALLALRREVARIDFSAVASDRTTPIPV